MWARLRPVCLYSGGFQKLVCEEQCKFDSDQSNFVPLLISYDMSSMCNGWMGGNGWMGVTSEVTG